MRVCLVRHAIAARAGFPGVTDDFSRPLTAKGRSRMEEAARGLRGLVVPEVILTSPLVRARETAEILAAACGVEDIRTTELLASPDYEGLIALLNGLGMETVMTVGHEPYTSRMVSLLLTGDSDRVDIVMKKGGAALVALDGDLAAGAGTLQWLIQPAGLRALATR